MARLEPGSGSNGTTPNVVNTMGQRTPSSTSLARGWFADPSRAFLSSLSRVRSHRVSKAGTFIRQTPSVKYGTTFTRALFSKYVEDLHGSQRQELVVLGSSNGAIEVEAVNLDKIRNKLSHLEKLREVSLDGENVAAADPSGEIGRTCPGAWFPRSYSVRFYRLHALPAIRGLDLTRSLIPSWDTIAQIARELPLLERLALKYVFSPELFPPARPHTHISSLYQPEQICTPFRNSRTIIRVPQPPRAPTQQDSVDLDRFHSTLAAPLT